MTLAWAIVAGRITIARVPLDAPQQQPAFCKDGSLSKYARYFPMPGPGGRQILLEDPSGNPVELFEPARS